MTRHNHEHTHVCAHRRGSVRPRTRGARRETGASSLARARVKEAPSPGATGPHREHPKGPDQVGPQTATKDENQVTRLHPTSPSDWGRLTLLRSHHPDSPQVAAAQRGAWSRRAGQGALRGRGGALPTGLGRCGPWEGTWTLRGADGLFQKGNTPSFRHQDTCTPSNPPRALDRPDRHPILPRNKHQPRIRGDPAPHGPDLHLADRVSAPGQSAISRNSVVLAASPRTELWDLQAAPHVFVCTRGHLPSFLTVPQGCTHSPAVFTQVYKTFQDAELWPLCLSPLAGAHCLPPHPPTPAPQPACRTRTHDKR